MHDDMSLMVPPTTNLTALNMPRDREIVYRWAVNNGGAPANVVTATLTVWGNKDRPTILVGIRAVNVHCQEAPAWTFIYPLGGGEIGERMVSIDFDSASLDARPVEDEITGEVFKFPLQVSRSDIERFRIRGATKSDCSYQLELGYEEAGTVKYVAAGSGPYRVISSSRASEKYRWTPLEAMESAEDRVTLEPCPPDECNI